MDRRHFVKSMAPAGVSGPATLTGESAEQGQPKKSRIPMRLRGRTGVEATTLILGGIVAMKQAPTTQFHPAELADAALDAGIDYFDTAPAYDNRQSERDYGEMLATRRKEVFLATNTSNDSTKGSVLFRILTLGEQLCRNY